MRYAQINERHGPITTIAPCYFAVNSIFSDWLLAGWQFGISAGVFHTCRWKLCYLGKNLYFIVSRSHYVSYLNIKTGTVHSLRRCTAEFFFPSFLLSFPLLCLHLAVSAVSSFLTFSPLTGLQFLFFYPRLSSVCFINQWVVPLYCSSGSNQIHSGIECV